MRLLVSDPQWTWRNWLKDNLGQGDLVCLDLGNADYGPAARTFLLREQKVREWRFVGSIHQVRNPVDVMAGAARHLQSANEDATVLSFALRESPVVRHMALALAECAAFKEVLVPEGSGFLHEPWLTPTTTVELPESLPETALTAQRRARWLEMLESCTEQTLELDHVGLYGTRLGGGRKLTGHPFDELGVHVEAQGSTLLVVSDQDVNEDAAADALNLAHATKLDLVSTTAYEGLLCSFVRGNGEDFGIGVVKSIDFQERKATFLNTAVAPAPVRNVRIGSLRIDTSGKETGETKPWAV